MKGFEEELKDLMRQSAQRTPLMVKVANSAQYKGMVGVIRAASLGRQAAPARCFLLVGIVPTEISFLAGISVERFSVPWTLLSRGPFELPYIWPEG